MPKKANKVRKKKSSGKIPKHGRPEKHVQRELGLNYSANVPLGNTGPTVVQGKLIGGGGSGRNIRSTGRLRTLKGKRGG